jgi:hypothetical protein
LSLPEQVDGIEFRIILVELFPSLSSSRKAEYLSFIFGYKDRDIASQNLFLPAMRPVLFVQGAEERVGDDAGVSRLPTLDMYAAASSMSAFLIVRFIDCPDRRSRDDCEPPMHE